MGKKTREIVISGTVQGVGFRPFVFRSAVEYGIAGSVKNSYRGVVIIAQGNSNQLDLFIENIRRNAPPLAVINAIEIIDRPDTDILTGFEICESESGGDAVIDITRDTAPCEACNAELFDPANRRFHHPFINCTNCGPRYSIITGLPYDRSLTTMAPFAMCFECAREYADPLNRRFHAQPVCCNKCGPSLTLLDSEGNVQVLENTEQVIAETKKRLASGEILAIKGVGGFHLACRADDDRVVMRLRQRKKREEKPFALMVRDCASARRYCLVSIKEEKLLVGVERPIVLCSRSKVHDVSNTGIAYGVAFGLSNLGIMLPSSPLHQMLFDTDLYDVLVMTSANMSGEPICHLNDEVVRQFRGVVDAFLIHNRDIHLKIDDSVVRMIGSKQVMIRRARGFTPTPLQTKLPVQGLVALGGIMKSAIGVGRGSTCYVSHFLGTADSVASIDNCAHVIDHYLTILGVKPELFIKDLHPSGLSGKLTSGYNLPVVAVQHHFAHAVACMGENDLSDPVLAVVYDGTGMGTDGTIWGGEILHLDRKSFSRAGHWKHLLMPGGDEATVNTGRMALGALFNAKENDILNACLWMDQAERMAILELLSGNVNCIRTSSMGRLFDSVAGLLDVCRSQKYEGQAAIQLEGIADKKESGRYDCDIKQEKGMFIADGPGLLVHCFRDLKCGVDSATVAARFHNSVAYATAEMIYAINRVRGVKDICLSGGCFQNELLISRLLPLLEKQGLSVHLHSRLSPGDECIAFGQLLIGSGRR